MDEHRLEALTVAMNRELYAEGVGLPYDQTALKAYAAELEDLFQHGLHDSALRDMALDGLAETRLTDTDLQLLHRMDETLAYPGVLQDGQPISWRNWKQAERELSDAARRSLFDYFVEASEALVPLIVHRYGIQRTVYGEHGTTPLEVFARRERMTPAALRGLALRLGEAGRAPFQAAVHELAGQVFGDDEVTAAELRALYLNRMYEPLARLFAGRDPMADVRTAFGRLGFRLEAIATDFEDRPKKYAGAFCFPVRIPDDVRVSVRPASPHHLADMLFHEFGHAVHFAGIDARRSYADRYWIHAGVHETFSTLFEMLLGLPTFLSEGMGFDEQASRRLAQFDRFKNLLTGVWHAAAGAAVCDAWLEALDWPTVERRFAAYFERFVGAPAPPGFASLHTYVANLDPYPLGYLVAGVRAAHWLDDLHTGFGARWWADRRAGDAIREKIRPGGSVRFPNEWLDPAAFLRRWVG